MLILTDSGILTRLYNRADPDHAAIEKTVKSHKSAGDVLAFSLQNAAEFWSVCSRPASSRGGLGLDIPETRRRLLGIEGAFSFLADPQSLYDGWLQLVVTHNVMGKQVHDAKLVALMQLYGITHILTLNDADFVRYPGIVPINPAKSAPFP